MPALEIRLDGGRQLRAGLANVEGGLDDLKAAHKEAAGIAADGAADRVPVVSGKLAGTIRAAGTKTAGIVRVGTKRAPYGGPINYGWAKRNIRPAFFLNDGAQATEPRWIPVYMHHLEDLVNKVKGD